MPSSRASEAGLLEANSGGEVAAVAELSQYLTFCLAEETYALNVARVLEVLELSRITRIPRTPEHLLGVINVRGKAVPVVDMRRKFGMTVAEATVDTCIVVLQVVADGEPVTLGAMVDSVREVIDLPDEELEPAPTIGTGMRVEFIKGMARAGEAFVMVLEIDRIFSEAELSAVRESLAAEPGES